MKRVMLSVGVICTIMSCNNKERISQMRITNEQEIINTCEDLTGWIAEDVEQGLLDGEISESYIHNLETIMIRQQEIIDERNS
jgi:hypothetical protein